MKYKKQKPGRLVSYRLAAIDGIDADTNPAVLSKTFLSDGCNVANTDGRLGLRPGLRAEGPPLCRVGGDTENLQTFTTAGTVNLGFGSCTVGAVTYYDYSPYCLIAPFALNENGTYRSLPVLEPASPGGDVLYQPKNVSFISASPVSGKGLFMILTLVASTESTTENFLRFYELSSDLSSWCAVDRKALYTPVCLRYGHGNNYLTAAENEGTVFRTPEKLEQPNALNGAIRCDFTCDEYSDTFTLPYTEFSTGSDDTVMAELYISETNRAVFTIPAGQNISSSVLVAGNAVQMTVERSAGKIRFLSAGVPFPLPRYRSENGLKITVYQYNKEEAYDLFSAPSAEATYDGRLFRGSAKHARVYYSGKNNPFYFGKANAVSVGQTNEPITAISTQNRYLFVFKSHSVFRLSVTESREYDIERIVRENLKSDITELSFRLTVTHSTIGCDCPQSLCFCGNRLVWYHSDGAVYTLYGSNNYTEGNIYCLSHGIESRLAEFSAVLRGQGCALYDGRRYLLVIGQNIFALDTSANGFTYFSGNQPESGGLCWLIWQTNCAVRIFATVSCGGAKAFVCTGESTTPLVFFCESKDDFDSFYNAAGQVCTAAVPYFFRTAEIPADGLLISVELRLSNNENATFSVFTDQSESASHILPANSVFHTADYLPGAVFCRYAGVRVNGSGKFILDELELTVEKEN